MFMVIEYYNLLEISDKIFTESWTKYFPEILKSWLRKQNHKGAYYENYSTRRIIKIILHIKRYL